MAERNVGSTAPHAGRRFPVEVLTRAEVRGILAAFSRRGSAGIRNAAMTVLMYRCGVRINEALSAPASDLDLTAGTFFVRYPKRDRKGRAWPRTVGVDAEAAALLERWVVRRRELGIKRSAPLFCQIETGRRGRPMHGNGYRGALQRAAEKAGVDKRVHPHQLRHSFAFEWVQEQRPLNHLQKALGHKNLSTTAHYADHLNPREMLESMRDRAGWVQDQGAAAPALAVTPDLIALVRAVLAEQQAGGLSLVA